MESKNNNKPFFTKWRLIAGAGVLSLLILIVIYVGSYRTISAADEGVCSKTHTTATMWTCSMHPDVLLKQQGSCPKCGMNLVPIKGEACSAKTQAVATIWTCPMHPNVQLAKQQPCPLCGMKLVPMAKAGAQGGKTAGKSCCPPKKAPAK